MCIHTDKTSDPPFGQWDFFTFDTTKSKIDCMKLSQTIYALQIVADNLYVPNFRNMLRIVANKLDMLRIVANDLCVANCRKQFMCCELSQTFYVLRIVANFLCVANCRKQYWYVAICHKQFMCCELSQTNVICCELSQNIHSATCKINESCERL